MDSSNSKGKKIAKNTLMMYIRMFITMSISLYTSRIVLNALGVEDFGIYNVVGGLVTLFTFINAAMMAATQRFINYELGRNNETGLSEVFKTAYIIHIAIAIVIIIAGLTLGAYIVEYKLKLPDDSRWIAKIVLYCSIATCALQILTLPFSSDVIAHEKINVYAWISIAESVLRLGVAFLIKVSPSNRLIEYALLLLCVQGLLTLVYYLYCRLNFSEVRGRLKIYRLKLKEMGSFAVWCLIGCTAGAFSGQGVNVLLGMFFSPIVNAARGIAVQVQSAINTFGSNLNTAMTPQITQSYAAKDYDLFFTLLYRGSKYIFFLMALVAIPIMIKTRYILQLWLGEVPEYTIQFLRWIVSATIIEAISYPLMRASDATGNIKLYHSVVGGILLSILPLSYLAITLTHNPVSVFKVYFAIQCIAWMARLFILRKTANLSFRKYFIDVIIRIISIYILGLVIIYHCDSFIPDNFIGLIEIFLLSTIVVISLSYTIGMDKAERNFIISKFRSTICKKK